MASMADIAGNEAALARQRLLLAEPRGPERTMANAIRALTIDAVEAAKVGHPGMPLGMADVATVLWTKILKYDAADAKWADRDRFVLSAGHGSMLLYSLLHLTGHQGMEIEVLKRFRQLHSAAAGHPEYHEHPAIEMTTGPLGQGLATAVGMAIAERMLAAKFGKSLVDHRTWVMAGDGCLMEGISHEAGALAGHLKLSKLTVLFDDNSISIDGATGLSQSDDPLKRFASYGWAVRRIDGHDFEQIQSALAFAAKSNRPTMIACKTIIGFGAPNKAGSAGSHGAALGGAEAEAAKRGLGWEQLPFVVPEDVAAPWRAAGSRGVPARRAWLKRLAKHPQKAEFERVMAGRLPEGWVEAMSAFKATLADQKPKLATRQSSQKALEVLVPAIPELAGGSADLTGSNLTHVKGMAAVSPDNFGGKYLYYGVREHGMAAAMNGISLHGGLIPYGGTFFVFTDYMRPSIRLAALMGVRVIHVLTHDSIAQCAGAAAGRCDGDRGMLGAGDPQRHGAEPAGALPPGGAGAARYRQRQSMRPRRLCASRGGGQARRDAGRHRQRGCPGDGRESRFGQRRHSGRRGVAAELRAVCPPGCRLSRGSAGRSAAHRHRGRLRLRLGAYSRQSWNFHRDGRIWRQRPGRRPLRTFWNHRSCDRRGCEAVHLRQEHY